MIRCPLYLDGDSTVSNLARLVLGHRFGPCFGWLARLRLLANASFPFVPPTLNRRSRHRHRSSRRMPCACAAWCRENGQRGSIDDDRARALALVEDMKTRAVRVV